jgi:hypothetical protein
MIRKMNIITGQRPHPIGRRGGFSLLLFPQVLTGGGRTRPCVVLDRCPFESMVLEGEGGVSFPCFLAA